MVFRITTWNVNGIRNPFSYQPWREKRTFEAMFSILEADIVVMQETKIQRKDLTDDIVLVPGWDVFFSLPKHKKGYSGVAIYTRNASCAPIRAEEGVTGILTPPRGTTSYRELPKDQQIGGYPRPGQLAGGLDEATLDSEGRCVILEFPAFVLFGVYSPANRDETRTEFREGFFEALEIRIRNLIREGKQVILTGDLNVVRSEMDTSGLADTLRKMDMSIDDWMNLPARRIFNQLIHEGTFLEPRDEGREKPVLWDLCRCFHPNRKGMNTCWDTKRNTRPANYGSRIDYVLCSDGLKGWFIDSNIQEGLMGSDHCPVYGTIGDIISTSNGRQLPLSVAMNPPDMFQGDQRMRSWAQKDLLPLSAKLIPEFDRRRNIRDMFFRKQATLSRDEASTQEDDKERRGNGEEDLTSDPAPKDDLQNQDSGALGTPNLDAETDSTASWQAPRAVHSKRPADTAGTAVRPKRNKTNLDGGNAKHQPPSGQRTLQGFFKSTSNVKNGAAEPSTRVNEGRSTPPAPDEPLQSKDQASSASPRLSPPQKASLSSPEKIAERIQARDSWSKLLRKRVVPRCDHDEPCISLVTKKPGVNCGRSFYICPRPLGPSGEKEKGSEWRCGTFIWSSDWNGPST